MTLVYFYLSKLVYNTYTLRALVCIYESYVEGLPLNERIDWYASFCILQPLRVRLMLFHFWLVNPYRVLFFLLLLPLNILLRSIYMFCFLAHVPYWSWKLLCYSTVKVPIDLKPVDYLPGFTSWHFALLYYVTWKRAQLNSFGILYAILWKLLAGKSQPSVLTTLLRLPFTLVWYIFRLVTSIPRQVLLDSYSWSGRFENLDEVYGWESNFVHGIIPQLIRELGPKAYKRVYFANNTRWNFNPSPLHECYLRSLKNKEIKEFSKISDFDLFKSGMEGKVKVFMSSIEGLTGKPHVLTGCDFGKKEGVSMFYANSLSSKPYPPSNTLIKTFPTLEFNYDNHYVLNNLLLPKHLIDTSTPSFKKGTFLDVYSREVSCNLFLLSFCSPSAAPSTDLELTKLLLATVYKPDALACMSEFSVTDIEEFIVKYLVDSYPAILDIVGSVKFSDAPSGFNEFH